MEEFTFCESVVAGVTGRWHIRKVSTKLFLSGGIDTESLCGGVKPFGTNRGAIGGWDLNVKITDKHLEHSCVECVAAYKKITGCRGPNG
jgi:hypothetical protein